MSGFGGGFGAVGGAAGKAEPRKAELDSPTVQGFASYGVGGYINNKPQGGERQGWYIRTNNSYWRDTFYSDTTGGIATPAEYYLSEDGGFPEINGTVTAISATTTGLKATAYFEMDINSPLFDTYFVLNEAPPTPSILSATAPVFRFSKTFEPTTATGFGAQRDGVSLIGPQMFPHFRYLSFSQYKFGGYVAQPMYSPSVTIRAGIEGITPGQASGSASIYLNHRRVTNITPVEDK